MEEGWHAIVATLMTVGMLGACGSSSSSSGTKITIFNSKVEIESQMEDMAAKYSKEKGVDVEVYYSNDTVAAHLATKYASKIRTPSPWSTQGHLLLG